MNHCEKSGLLINVYAGLRHFKKGANFRDVKKVFVLQTFRFRFRSIVNFVQDARKLASLRSKMWKIFVLLTLGWMMKPRWGFKKGQDDCDSANYRGWNASFISKRPPV
jgi:hypothetical protein